MIVEKLFEGEIAEVSTAAYHATRDRARHLEQEIHRPRLMSAARLVLMAQRQLGCSARVSDLGCGDGGLLSLIQHKVAEAWGYDFTPANALGWSERGVKAECLDVFGADKSAIRFGDITVMTEVLEHLTDPIGALTWVTSRFLVASSPWVESKDLHDECHAWAWDLAGFRSVIERGGYQVVSQSTVGFFQVVLGERYA